VSYIAYPSSQNGIFMLRGEPLHEGLVAKIVDEQAAMLVSLSSH